MSIENIRKFSPSNTYEIQGYKIQGNRPELPTPLIKKYFFITNDEENSYFNWIIKEVLNLSEFSLMDANLTAYFLKIIGDPNEVISVIKSLPDIELRDKKLIEFSQRMELQNEFHLALFGLENLSDPKLLEKELLEFSKRLESKNEYYYATEALKKLSDPKLLEKELLEFSKRLESKNEYRYAAEALEKLSDPKLMEKEPLDFSKRLESKNEHFWAETVLKCFAKIKLFV